MNQMLADQAVYRAKKSLVHYFRLLFKEQGITFHSDCRLEVELIIDDIIIAVTERDHDGGNR